eukprot:scaffold71769_cov13-Tisochrysis_lutea.AAC.1
MPGCRTRHEVPWSGALTSVFSSACLVQVSSSKLDRISLDDTGNVRVSLSVKWIKLAKCIWSCRPAASLHSALQTHWPKKDLSPLHHKALAFITWL